LPVKCRIVSTVRDVVTTIQVFIVRGTNFDPPRYDRS
jgi:hypothetical protein